MFNIKVQRAQGGHLPWVFYWSLQLESTTKYHFYCNLNFSCKSKKAPPLILHINIVAFLNFRFKIFKFRNESVFGGRLSIRITTSVNEKNKKGGMKMKKSIRELQETARRVRINILKMITKAESGHPGGSLSTVEMLVAPYFIKELFKHNPIDPEWEGRDRLVLSKGHAVPALYAVLAKAGYFSKDRLLTLRTYGSGVEGHSVIQTLPGKVPGVEATTGPLGTGLPQACGMALGFKIKKAGNFVFAIVGEGECQEGIIWEAAMFAKHYKLDNLIVMVDKNDFQIDGRNEEVMSLEPFRAKWESFGFFAQEINGHDFNEIINAIRQAKEHKDTPSVIIAHTVKGKGVSFMENDPTTWHGKAPGQEQLKQALTELGGGE